MKLFWGHNDYELLYLIRDNHDTDALTIMLAKYEGLIGKKLSQFYINGHEREDLRQDAIILLHKAIYLFNDCYNKTFTRYFELLLERKLINFIRKTKKERLLIEKCIMDLKEPTSHVLEDIVIAYDANTIMTSFHSELEMIVYQEYFVNNVKISQIAKEHQFNIRQIYNAIYRIKGKLK